MENDTVLLRYQAYDGGVEMELELTIETNEEGITHYYVIATTAESNPLPFVCRSVMMRSTSHESLDVAQRLFHGAIAEMRDKSGIEMERVEL